MKKTILISLLAFMMLPIMAQKPDISDCDRYAMQKPGDVQRMIYTNKVTGEIEYHAHELIADLIDGVGTIYDPDIDVTYNIGVRQSPSGNTNETFASLAEFMAYDGHELECKCTECGYWFFHVFTCWLFPCPTCGARECGSSCSPPPPVGKNGTACTCSIITVE